SLGLLRLWIFPRCLIYGGNRGYVAAWRWTPTKRIAGASHPRWQPWLRCSVVLMRLRPGKSCRLIHGGNRGYVAVIGTADQGRRHDSDPLTQHRDFDIVMTSTICGLHTGKRGGPTVL